MQVQSVTMESFESVVDNHEMVVLDFWAEGCQPCKILAPVFEELAKHHLDIYFGKVDTRACPELAQAFQVRSVPTLMAFKKGELVFEQAGLLPPDALIKLLDKLRQINPDSLGASLEEEPSL